MDGSVAEKSLAEGVYGPSASWREIGGSHEAVLSSPDGWKTFRRTIAGRYFTDPDYTEKDIEAAYRYLTSQGVQIRETDFDEGDPVRIVKGSKIITQDLLISASELHSIEEMVDMSAISSMVEIGGGYGRMALLVKQRYPHIRYTIIDVEPAIDVAKKFLGGKFEASFLSPKEAETLQNVDLFYCSSVLSELDHKKVNFYFQLVGKTGRFFYLKDWKWGHHTNDLPALMGFALRVANKLSHVFLQRKSKLARSIRRLYTINENNFPKKGWKELLHRNCENSTGYASKLAPEWGFFEVIYQINNN